MNFISINKYLASRKYLSLVPTFHLSLFVFSSNNYLFIPNDKLISIGDRVKYSKYKTLIVLLLLRQSMIMN